ncbi:radical SAM protein [Candidatus Pacearchaeota archaeon]|nr:radical SAM protein [Candidatus Pacearchaeota archaeon]
MQLTRELFVLPQERDFILYAPLDNTALKVSSGVIDILRKIRDRKACTEQEQALVECLKRSGIIKDKTEEPSSLDCKLKGGNGEIYSPTYATLIPTYNCNLRCVYCYSNGGESPTKIMEFNVAKSAINLAIENAKRLETGETGLEFHGGGEPFLPANMELIKRSLDYFRKNAEKSGLKYTVGSVTNGVMNQKDLEWIVQTFSHLNISLDGPEDIQNSQRPKPRNLPSYEDVMRTITYLEGKKFKYGIRATITAESVDRMPEIIEFFHSISTSDSFHVEPLFECGRCKTTNAKAPEPQTFLKRFLEARETAKKLGIKIYYSGARINCLSTSFCGASGENFFVNPNGNVITCPETSRETDPDFSMFHIGSYDSSTQSFRFHQDKIRLLKSRTIDNIPHCSNCFAKYNCSGDCPAKSYSQSRNLFDTSSNPRCLINRELLKQEIYERLEKPTEVQKP